MDVDSPGLVRGPDLPVLDDPIRRKYDALGGPALFGPVLQKEDDRFWSCTNGFLCYDNTAPDRVFEVHGTIHARWQKLGGRHSYLGLPTSDETEFDQGRANSFAGGGIYWWPDFGAIDLRGVSISYTGLRCVRMAGQELDDVDAYLLISEGTPLSVGTRRTQVYSGLTDDSSHPDLVEIYNGPPYGINLYVIVVEGDLADPDRYREDVERLVNIHHADRMSTLPQTSGVGPAVAGAAAPIMAALVPEWISAVEALTATCATVDGRATSLSPRDMVLLAAAGHTKYNNGIRYTVETSEVGRSGVTYQAYFELVPL